MAGNVISFEQKYPISLVYGVFDFSSLLTNGQTISTASCSVEVWVGVDPSPSAILLGSPTVSGTVVSQYLQNGVSGVIYRIACQANCSDGTNQVLLAYLPVMAEPV